MIVVCLSVTAPIKVVPRPHDAAFFESYQLTFETRKAVLAWTEGLFHDDADPRNWRLKLHIGNGVAADARLGNYIVKHTGYWEILTCDEYDRRYVPLDRPGNPLYQPANPPHHQQIYGGTCIRRECGCIMEVGEHCQIHVTP